MKIFLIGTHPAVQGPIARLTHLMKQGFEELGCQVGMGYWGRHKDSESFLARFLGRPLDMWPLVQQMRPGNYDVVFLNTSHDWPALIRDVPLVLAAQRSGIPFVVLYHGTCGPQLLDRSQRMWRQLFAWRLMRSAGLFVLASREAAVIRKLWPECHVATVRYPFLPNGNDKPPPPRDQTRGGARFELVFVGRLMQTKGIMDLLAAMPRVLAQLPCHLNVLGVGPLQDEAQEQVKQAGLNANVTLKGYLSSTEVFAVLNQADLFVLPTYHAEGFPVAVLEALSAGLPMIVSSAGGMEDWLKQDVHARYVPSRNPEALAGQIVALLIDADLRYSMSRANVELAKRFSPSLAMAEYLASIKSWI